MEEKEEWNIGPSAKAQGKKNGILGLIPVGLRHSSFRYKIFR